MLIRAKDFKNYKLTIDFKDIKLTQCTLSTVKKSTEYSPIDCGLYDYLEIWATHKQPLKISYLSEDNQLHNIESKINTTLTKDKEEFIVLESKSLIRLDKIINISEI